MVNQTRTRGCGVRSPGGIYVEVPLSKHGRPLEEFLIDPVIEIPDDLDLQDRGVTILERIVGGIKTGVYDVWDHVGARYYPNVWDFVTEVRRMGLSRRIQPNADFAKLTPDSRIVLLHSRAVLDNAHELYKAIDAEEEEYFGQNTSGEYHWWRCPCANRNPDHNKYPLYARSSNDLMPTCVGVHREIVTGGEIRLDPEQPPRTVERYIGSLSYLSRKKPEGFSPQYRDGIFMVLPARRLVVIRDPEGHQDAKAMQRASQSGLHVELEDA